MALGVVGCRDLFLPNAGGLGRSGPTSLRVATFRCDITPPLGQPLMACDPIRTVEQPLLAKGIVLEAGRPALRALRLGLVRLCNGSHDAVAEEDRGRRRHRPCPRGRAVRPSPHRAAGRYGRPKAAGRVAAPQCQIDPKVFDAIAERLAAAVKQSLDRLEPFDRIGVGQAKVDRVASNRRPVDAQGKIRVRVQHHERRRGPGLARGNRSIRT